MKNNTDILQSSLQLKTMPYSTPEGYFDRLKSELKVAEPSALTRSWKSLVPYMAAAAMFALLIVGGSFFISRSATMNDFTQEDYIVFSDNMTNTLFSGYDNLFADAEDMNEDDIIEYLIYTGISLEDIESMK